MNKSIQLSVNERVLAQWGSDEFPSPSTPSYRFTLFTPSLVVGSRINDMTEKFWVFSLTASTEVELFNFKTGFICFSVRLLGFGFGVSKQTGF